MKRKFLIFLMAAVLVMSAAVPGACAETDSAEVAGMTLTLSVSKDLDADLRGIESLNVRLYKIASMDESYNFTNVPYFPGVNLKIISRDTAAAEWEKNIQYALGVVEGGSVPPTLEAQMQVEGGVIKPLTIDLGNRRGIYLVIVDEAEGEMYKISFLPTMVSVPENQYRTVKIQTEAPAESETTESVATSDDAPEETPLEDTWNYKVSAVLKPETERLNGKLEIVKTLDKFATITGTVSFVFQIEGTDPEDGDKVVYSNVVAMRFDNYGAKSVQLEVPLGLDYTVTEVYSGGSYKIKWDGYGEDDGVVKIAADQFSDQKATASFENDNDDRLIPGNGIENHFHNDVENEDWPWSSEEKTGATTAVGGAAKAG